MSPIDVAEAKRDLDQLLERASQGEEVVITKKGRPLARLTAPTSTLTRQQRQFGSIEGEIWMNEDFDEPLDDLEEYME
jgi:antitoxin (DNA-binding transcriptional repressor) of toxin-antitoxin stability system